MSLFGNLKAAWKNRKAIKAVSKAVDEIKEARVKDGYKTSEFWGKTLVQLIVVLNTLKGSDVNPELALVLVAGVEAAYAIGRSLVKVFKK
jgi:hypothetical protein